MNSALNTEDASRTWTKRSERINSSFGSSKQNGSRMSHSNGSWAVHRARVAGRWLWARAVYILAVVLFVLGITSLVLSLNAQTKAAEANARVAEEANQRALIVEAQNEKMRAGLCDLVQPIAASPAPPGNERAATFGKSAQHAGVVFECSPDPYDGR